MIEGGQALIQRIVYLFGNLVGLALAVYKCQLMGLLPTHPSDWLAFVEPQSVSDEYMFRVLDVTLCNQMNFICFDHKYATLNYSDENLELFMVLALINCTVLEWRSCIVNFIDLATYYWVASLSYSSCNNKQGFPLFSEVGVVWRGCHFVRETYSICVVF